jgi:hypothetical protein
MTCLLPLNPVPMKSVAHVVPAVMTAVAHVPPVTVALQLVPVVLQVAMPLLQTAVTSPQKHSVPINPPLSAFAKSPRQLQQLTVKENNHVATRSPEIPQRAKRP